MLTLELYRQPASPESTQGMLSMDGLQQCYTLEPAVPIPAGTYPVTLYPSPKFGRTMPLLNDVPGHSYIEIHWGNSAADTLDCILVGETRKQDWIGNSREAFDALFPLIEKAVNAEGCQIQIANAPAVTDPELGL